MPVMDGYEATRRIRQQACYQNLPVIAMTANVMSGDREKVLDAGMNDHIGKPVNVREMFTVMAKWIQPAPTGSRFQDAESSEQHKIDGSLAFEPDIPAGLPGIDTIAGLAITQNNPRLYHKLLTKFRDSQCGFAEQFAAACVSDDPQAATRCAHTLKGVAGNIGAKSIEEAARQLESACQSRAESGVIESLLAHVCAALEPVINGLATLDQAPPAVMSDAQTLDRAAVTPLLQRLRELLQDDDTDAASLIDELEPRLSGTLLAPSLLQMTQAIDDYNFESALLALERITRQLDTLPDDTAKLLLQ